MLDPNTSGSWFLLGPPYPGEPNKSAGTATWADVEVNFAKAGNQTCDTTACSGKKTLGALVNEGKIYDQVYEIVDPNGTDANTTFALKNILTDRASGANNYWVYVWPE